MSDKKMCPLMIGKEERKSITYGQGDVVVPIFYPCIGEKCMAYDGRGNCDYWLRTTRLESEEISDHNLKMWKEIYAEEKRREGSE